MASLVQQFETDFPKRIKWSPDGRELVANMESGIMNSYKYMNDQFSFHTEIKGHYAGFNDFEWYPWMSESLPGSDLFVSSSKDLPVQLWSSGEGKVVSSWTAKDHLDQVANCLSVTFSPDGQNILCGGLDRMWLFDFNRPGDHVKSEYSIEKKFDNTGVFAAASFKGTVGIFDYRSFETPCCVFNAHGNGTSQVKFLSDGWSLISAGRRNEVLKKWDLRMNSLIMEYKLPQFVRSNQRIYFDVSDKSVITGSNEDIVEFDLETGEISKSTHMGNVVSSFASSWPGRAYSTLQMTIDKLRILVQATKALDFEVVRKLLNDEEVAVNFMFPSDGGNQWKRPFGVAIATCNAEMLSTYLNCPRLNKDLSVGTCVDCIKMNSTSFQVNGVTYSDKEEKRKRCCLKPLSYAVDQANVAGVRQLLSLNIFDVDETSECGGLRPFSFALNQSRLDMVKDLYAAGARLRENSTEGRQPWNRMRSDLHCCLRCDGLFNFFMETDPNSFEGFELLYDAIDVIEYNCSTNCIFNGVENKLKRAGADFSPRGAGTLLLNPVALLGGFDQLLKNYRRPVNMNACTVEEFDKFVSLKPSYQDLDELLSKNPLLCEHFNKNKTKYLLKLFNNSISYRLKTEKFKIVHDYDYLSRPEFPFELVNIMEIIDKIVLEGTEVQELNSLLTKPSDVQFRQMTSLIFLNYKNTFLHKAILAKNYKMARILIMAFDCDVNYIMDGKSPLMIAVNGDDYEFVRDLVRFGGKFDHVNENGKFFHSPNLDLNKHLHRFIFEYIDANGFDVAEKSPKTGKSLVEEIIEQVSKGDFTNAESLNFIWPSDLDFHHKVNGIPFSHLFFKVKNMNFNRFDKILQNHAKADVLDDEGNSFVHIAAANIGPNNEMMISLFANYDLTEVFFTAKNNAGKTAFEIFIDNFGIDGAFEELASFVEHDEYLSTFSDKWERETAINTSLDFIKHLEIIIGKDQLKQALEIHSSKLLFLVKNCFLKEELLLKLVQDYNVPLYRREHIKTLYLKSKDHELWAEKGSQFLLNTSLNFEFDGSGVLKLFRGKRRGDANLVKFLLDAGYDLTYEWKEIKQYLSRWRRPLTDSIVEFVKHDRIKSKVKKRLVSKFLVFATSASQASDLISLGADPFMFLNKHSKNTCLHFMASRCTFATWKVLFEKFESKLDKRRLLRMKNKYGDTPIDNIHDKKVLLEYFPELISFKLSEIQANHKVLGDSSKCAICFADYTELNEHGEQETLVLLSCKHAFHLSCLKSVNNLARCLYCKKRFFYKSNKD